MCLHLTLLLSLLKSATSLAATRKLHSLLLVGGLLSYPGADLGTRLVNAYSKLGALHEALAVFGHLPTKAKNVFAFNAILRGLVNASQYRQTVELYRLMLREGLRPDNFTFPFVLKACSVLLDLEQGLEIKNLIYSNKTHGRGEANIFVECALIDMFAKCGSLMEARHVFDGMQQRDLVSWTAMICGTVQHGAWVDALILFRRMRLDGFSPDSVMVATVLPACGRLGALRNGAGLHGFSVRSGFVDDLCVANAMIDMYCKCGHMHEACTVFRGIHQKDVISWSSLVAGCSLNEEFEKGVALFVEMVGSGARPSPVTIASVLPAFSQLQLYKQGKELHGYALRHGFEGDGFVASALVDIYAKCGQLLEAELIFDAAWDRDVGVWNSMVAGYAMNDDVESTFRILRRIHGAGFRPNSITIISVLPVCTRLGTLKQGRELHGCATRNGLGPVVSVQNSIMDMYQKCGSLECATRIFEQMVERDRVTYNTIIAALGMHGHGHQASSLLTRMAREGIKPDKVTFIALLSACSHAGMMDLGWYFYTSMVDVYGIVPEMEHYSCMVDLLGRSGCLDDAWGFIKKMPIDPEVDVLGSLLGACRIHKRIDLAELVGERIFARDLIDPGYHVLLANIYAAAGRWEDVSRIRNRIRDEGLNKKPGNSWIQVDCSVHLFVAKDKSYMQIPDISQSLDSLLLHMKDEGYVTDLSFFLLDLGEDKDI